MQSDTCEDLYVDQDRVERVREGLEADDTIMRLAETFKLLGDPTRTKMLMALAREELCVCDLAGLLEVSSSAVSHQLRLLRNADLVKYRRQGKMAYYTLSDHHVEQIFGLGIEHVQERVGGASA
jgi:DNA-binding transcriptional ArsR family regulator